MKVLGSALLTRTTERDYFWFCEHGSLVLMEKARELNSELTSDRDAKPEAPATFFLLEEGDRVGLLVSVDTTRRDYGPYGRIIKDTVWVEFDAAQRAEIYRIAAGLLGPQSDSLQQQILAYGEGLFEGKAWEEITLGPVADWVEPKVMALPDSDHIVLAVSKENCRRVAELLAFAAEWRFGRSVLFVCTAYTGRTKLAQSASKVDWMLALVKSQTAPSEPEAITTKKKWWRLFWKK